MPLPVRKCQARLQQQFDVTEVTVTQRVIETKAVMQGCLERRGDFGVALCISKKR